MKNFKLSDEILRELKINGKVISHFKGTFHFLIKSTFTIYLYKNIRFQIHDQDNHLVSLKVDEEYLYKKLSKDKEGGN